jgi:hypothetical protein
VGMNKINNVISWPLEKLSDFKEDLVLLTSCRYNGTRLKLTTHHYPVSKLRISGVVTPPL